MGARISGMVIDQTRTEGKWYVRELKDENGGITPVFFRREKSDLLGRLIDKFRHVESAQRYAARHMEELGIPVSITDTAAATGRMRSGSGSQSKLASNDLQKLLNHAVKDAARPPRLLDDDEAADGSNLSVTVIQHKPDRTQELDLLWDAFKSRLGTGNATKKAFYKNAEMAIRVCRGDMMTSDPKIWKNCKQFVDSLHAQADHIKLSGIAKNTLAVLEDSFGETANEFMESMAPASESETYWNASKVESAMTELGKVGPPISSVSAEDFKRDLRRIFQIFLAETSADEAREARSGRLPIIQVTQDVHELKRLLDLAHRIRVNPDAPSVTMDTHSLLHLAITALNDRLKRIDKTQ